MLNGAQLWHLMSHIFPVYVVMLLGYASMKLHLLAPLHLPGMNRYLSFYGIPTYVFILLSRNNPYNMNLSLLGADALQKVATLMILVLWWILSKSGSIDWVISIFMLVCLPNTVLIGDALLQPLYGDIINIQTVTIIFAQTLVWYNLCILLYEIRGVLMEDEAQLLNLPVSETNDQQTERSPSQNNANKSRISVEQVHNVDNSCAGTSSPPPRVSLSIVVHLPIEHQYRRSNVESDGAPHGSERDHSETPSTSLSGEQHAHEATMSIDKRQGQPSVFNEHQDAATESSANISADVELWIKTAKNEKKFGENQSFDFERTNSFNAQSVTGEVGKRARQTKFVYVKSVTRRVSIRLMKSPMTHASIAGFVYSLLAFKYNFSMPYILQQSTNLIGGESVGLAIFILGTTMGVQKSLVSCGWKWVGYACFIRFLIGPVTMILASLAFRLKGNIFRFSVLQAVIPQGVISFVFAKEFNLHTNVFATAVTFQMLAFLPIVIVYNIVLDQV